MPFAGSSLAQELPLCRLAAMTPGWRYLITVQLSGAPWWLIETAGTGSSAHLQEQGGGDTALCPEAKPASITNSVAIAFHDSRRTHGEPGGL